MSNQNNKTLVVGPSGSGKTTLLKSLVEKADQKKIVIFDTQGDEFPLIPGAAVVHSLSELGAKWFETRITVYVPDISDPVGTDFGPDFLELLSRLYQLGGNFEDIRKGRILVVADEIDIATSGIDEEALKRVIQVSRRQGIDYLLAAHRLAEVPPAIRDQMTVLHHFKATDPTTLKMIGSYIDPEGITSLEQYEHKTIRLR